METTVEPQDILAEESGEVHLIHVKISTRSSSLSHLFNQGANSVERSARRLNQKKAKELVGNNPGTI